MSPAVGVSPLNPAYVAPPSFGVSPSGLRRRVSRGRQIVPCTAPMLIRRPPGGRSPKRSGSASVTNCLASCRCALAATPVDPSLRLLRPERGVTLRPPIAQSRYTGDILPTLHRFSHYPQHSQHHKKAARSEKRLPLLTHPKVVNVRFTQALPPASELTAYILPAPKYRGS